MLDSQSGFSCRSYLSQSVPRFTLRCNVLPAIALAALQRENPGTHFISSLHLINAVKLCHSCPSLMFKANFTACNNYFSPNGYLLSENKRKAPTTQKFLFSSHAIVLPMEF